MVLCSTFYRKISVPDPKRSWVILVTHDSVGVAKHRRIGTCGRISPARNCPQRAAAFKRSDGRGVGVSRTAFSAPIGAWVTTQAPIGADDHGWTVLHAARRFVVADAAHGFPAGFDSAKLFLRLAGQWPLELPRRWVVERTFAWFGRNRRLAKDFEATIESSTAWLPIASEGNHGGR